MTETLTAAHAALLGRVDLFSTLDRIALARLAACAEPLAFAVDEDVCREGDPADGLYVVVRGTFCVLARDPRTGRHGRIGVLGPGEVFGELAMLEDVPRTATVRAESGGEVLRLERERVLELLKFEPAIALAVATILGRRLRAKDHLHVGDQQAAAEVVDTTLAQLGPDLRRQVLDASVLVEPEPVYLHALFGADAERVGDVLESLGATSGPRQLTVRGELRARLARAEGRVGVERAAEAASQRLLQAGHNEEALRVLDDHRLHPAFGLAVAEVLRSRAPLSAEREEYWLARVAIDEAALEPSLPLTWSAYQERHGAHDKAVSVLRLALRSESIGHDPGSAKALTTELARLDGGSAGLIRRMSRGWRTWFALALASGCVVLTAALTILDGPRPTVSFALLLAAAIVLWIANVFPVSMVGLGLVAGWILTATATSDQALAGFATLDWIFVLSVFSMSAAIASSGLLFRVGLLLVRRLPNGLFWQSGSSLLTGVLLTPLLPGGTGRAAVTEPFALTVADTLRVRDRTPAAAVLGLATWIGAGPLRFMFLNGSSVCLLAWGLLPPASRARFDWITWTLAALPLGLVAGFGGLLMLFLLFRPEQPAATVSGRSDVQLAVLGPLSRREISTVVILALLMAGWIVAPVLGIQVALVALLGVLAAVATGNLTRQGLQSLDWDYLVFYGVAITLVHLAALLGVDRVVANAIGGRVAESGLGDRAAGVGPVLAHAWPGLRLGLAR